MAKQITNQAHVSYSFGQTTVNVSSNIATATILDTLLLEKKSLGDTYTAGSEITYFIYVTNNSDNIILNATISDNLGVYALNNINVIPLTYIGPAFYHVNGVFVSELTPTVTQNSVIFTIGSIGTRETAMIVYKAAVNEFAPLESCSTITNSVTINANELRQCQTLTASATITAEDFADVSILKTIIPNPVSEGDELTYLFELSNTGNTNANSVTLNDTFDPILNSISITVNNGPPVTVNDFSYLNGVLQFPKAGSSYPLFVPAAQMIQNEQTGVITVIPGVTTVEVRGSLCH